MGELPVNAEQSRLVELKVEAVRASVVKAALAALADMDPNIKGLFEANREVILQCCFPRGDGLDDLGLSYKAGRRVLDEVEEALSTKLSDAILPPPVIVWKKAH